jgi:hypothetical protein
MRARKTFVAGLVTSAVLAMPAAGMAYGPGGGGNPSPPGFGSTITSVDCTSTGCHAAGVWHKCHLKVTVPARTFAHHVTVVISKIKNSAANQHFPGGHRVSVCAFGVGFFRNGMRIHVAEGRPSVNLLFTGDPIKSSDHLVILVVGDGFRHKHAAFSDGQATSTLRATRELAITRAVS